jgi:hypothetical protein
MVLKDKSDEKTDYDKSDRSPNVNSETFEDTSNSIAMKKLKSTKERDRQSKIEQKVPSLYDTQSLGGSRNSTQTNESMQFQSNAGSSQFSTPGSHHQPKDIKILVNMEDESVGKQQHFAAPHFSLTFL